MPEDIHLFKAKRRVAIVRKLWEYRECKTIFKEKGDTNVRGLAAL